MRKMLATILALALLSGVVMAIDIPDIPTPGILSQVSNPISTISQNTPTPSAILSQMNTVPSLLPSAPRPTVMPTVIPPIVSPATSNVPKLSDIQGGIPTALQQAGVRFNGLKSDQLRYRNAIATDATGNPLMINDKVGLPYFLSNGAVPYQLPGMPTKQSQNALVDGKAVYLNPDGTTTTVPLAVVVDQGAFHLWYKSTYSDPFIVLPKLG